MEEEKKPPKKGRGPKTAPGRPELPKKDDGTLDKEKVRGMFMASAHVEWSPFAQSQGWDPVRTAAQYPTSAWTKEKKDILAQKQAEEVSEMLFNHRSRWHKDVLKTLQVYPTIADNILGILQHRVNEYVEIINGDIEQAKLQAQAKAALGVAGVQTQTDAQPRQFSKVKNSELMALSIAFKTIAEAKHKTLLINDWSVKVAEQFSTPQGILEADEKANENKEWSFQLVGGEKITKHEMEVMMHRWFDPPQQKAEALPPPEEPVKDEAGS